MRAAASFAAADELVTRERARRRRRAALLSLNRPRFAAMSDERMRTAGSTAVRIWLSRRMSPISISAFVASDDSVAPICSRWSERYASSRRPERTSDTPTPSS